MKLIDILVQELPKRGGWIKGHYQCAQDKNGEVCFYTKGKIHLVRYGMWSIPEDSEATHDGESRVVTSLADDYAETIITREQYEAALADSKPEWDGEGLPPVGSKVSFFYNDRYNYNEEIIPQDGQELEVVAHKTTTDEHEVAVCYWDEDGGGMAVCLVSGSLRPIRSEADKKRDEAIKKICEVLSVGKNTEDDAKNIYEYIKSGKIVID
ncbi:hypothetical protein L8Q54_15245 [Enterobacter kobei]|uniref:hypothetical protein n=1 Tax=Enterobacter kobei TaxID=208224 RepID=UPI0020046BD0|nr:hypothetical protein [Enterobacter kobei]MCK6919621.1 hypothetical protein [Enterobacter kobei]